MGDLAPHDDVRLVEARVVGGGERGERDVDLHVAQPEVVGDRRHRGGDVGRARPVREQHLAHAQGEVE
jgi:hypothetical protein